MTMKDKKNEMYWMVKRDLTDLLDPLGLEGLKPAPSALTRQSSNQFNYDPK